ncbi:protein-disulfide reductase DsbD domain-containing protein [Mucilaginibacter sp. X5P1]|uniref:protein-disulfide reductase DsbD domain-containing protein n=1 Tax=Mucilaginibacter sp. X5P1 TaxID=2723088 RepID=UPI00160D76A2|nr:protein-disulfide reductase DsbD domain-containing protein [Mucilaginibacter sp. X5P1]MBB6137004.1 DsbC/DsbD-like thiol-disulfide interchange protein [Mucilaginibacter sp. X5P1]
MKKLIIATVILFMFTLTTKAQMLTPVHWSYGAKKLNNNEAVVFIKATIDDGWHVYSQTVKEGGPIKTTITFPVSASYTLIGKTIEPTPITRNEKVFNMDVSFFEHEVIFQQKIKLKTGQATVKGTLEYMTCNDHQCLPPEDVEFSVVVK